MALVSREQGPKSILCGLFSFKLRLKALTTLSHESYCTPKIRHPFATDFSFTDCIVSATLRAALVARKNSNAKAARTCALIETQVIYCGDNLDQLSKLPDVCVDLVYIDPPFNSNRNYEGFWCETRSFDERHASTQAYIGFIRHRCVELVRVLKSTGTLYHCDWHACHYVKEMPGQVFGEHGFTNEIWERQSSKRSHLPATFASSSEEST